KAAELAEEMHDKLAAGSFTEELGWQAVAQWRRGSEWARSNQAAVKLLKKTPKMAAERLRLLHYYMGENYRSLGLHANSVESYRQARELRDTPEVHFQMITAMYNN